ncbi:hypothetical protein CMUST_15580 (plasmid) [Corynebacterium mustelae]|uniref:DUF8176 domain-containing protein n=1 Tax=Corynebacterium mustelae TaxID=571915 RepID=A0A0G3H3S7_9CORY|nr:hypothetical protein [Corynebacterium mustelae]AKK07405.1 hypothetical protein CMUST_15580 [Corynebacterium mustelae]
MATSWFDIADERDAAAAADDVVEVVVDSPAADGVPAGGRFSRVVWVGFGVLLAVSVVGVVWSLQSQRMWVEPVSVSSSVVEVPPSVAVSSSSSSVPVSSVVVERCPGQPVGSLSSPEGVVVEFQEAYFAGDVERIASVVASGSYLASVDWGTVVSDVVGSEFCVKVEGVSGGVVDAATTVVTPGGEELLFMQKVTVVEVGGGFRILEIEDRPVPSTS